MRLGLILPRVRQNALSVHAGSIAMELHRLRCLAQTLFIRRLGHPRLSFVWLAYPDTFVQMELKLLVFLVPSLMNQQGNVKYVRSVLIAQVGLAPQQFVLLEPTLLFPPSKLATAYLVIVAVTASTV